MIIGINQYENIIISDNSDFWNVFYITFCKISIIAYKKYKLNTFS